MFASSSGRLRCWIHFGPWWETAETLGRNGSTWTWQRLFNPCDRTAPYVRPDTAKSEHPGCPPVCRVHGLHLHRL